MLPDIIPWTTISNTVSNFPVSEIILWSYLPSITYLHCKLKEEKWLLEHAVAANSIKARPFFSLLAKAFLFHRGPPQGFLWYKPLAGHPRSSQNGISRSKKSHILRAGQGSGKVIWRGVAMPPPNWTSPPLLPRTPNHFGRQNAAFFTFEFFLIGLVRIIFGPADRRGRGCDGRWRGLIFLLVIAFLPIVYNLLPVARVGDHSRSQDCLQKWLGPGGFFCHALLDTFSFAVKSREVLNAQ